MSVRLRFRVAHAASVHPSRRGVWYLHEHSASFAAMAMTDERWRAAGKKRARDVLRSASGPRWGVIAEDA